MAVEWVMAASGDVPPGDEWLGPRERAVLATLDGERRRAEWRLGRWAAKQLVGDDVEILPAADGAPEPWHRDERVRQCVSIAHRRGRALAAVADHRVGCDLEPLRDDRDVLPFVAWEAAAKALRRPLLEGPRPDLATRGADFVVRWDDGERVSGRTWVADDWALALAWVGTPG